MKKHCFVACLILAVCLSLLLALPAQAEEPSEQLPEGETFGLTVETKNEKTVVTVQLEATEDCTVVAALYSEEGALLTLGTAPVSGDCAKHQEIPVTMQKTVSAFHHAKAFLLYGDGQLPLCEVMSKDKALLDKSADSRDGSAEQPVETEEDGSIKEEVLLSVGDEESTAVTVEIPTGTKLEENVTAVAVTIQAAEAPAVIQMQQETNITTVAYDIQVEGLREENTSLIKVELQVPSGLENLKVYHHETELRQISEEAKAADGAFLYDMASGTLSIWTTSFSPFTLSFGTYKNWQDDFHNHKEAAMTYGYGLVLPQSLCRAGEIFSADLVDFTGSVHQAMNVSQQLYDVVLALDAPHPVLVRFETGEDGVMGNVELAKTLADGVSIGDKSADFGDYQLYNKSRTLVCTEESDGTISYRNVTGLLKDAYEAGDGVVIQYIVNTNADEPLVDCVMVYRGISEEEPVYSYAYALGGTLDAEATVELVDFSGKKTRVAASESLQNLLQTVPEDGDILVRYEVLGNNVMGTAEAASIAEEGMSLSGSDYVLEDGKTYATSKTQFLLCTSSLDGTPVYLPVTGYQELPAAFTVGEDTEIQYFLEQGSGYFVQYVVIEKAPSFGCAYVVGGTGKKVLLATGAGGTMVSKYSANLVSMDAEIEKNAAITEELYELLQNTPEEGLLIRYEIQLDGAMGAIEVAAIAPEGTTLGPSSYVIGNSQAYATSQTVFLLRTINLDGTVSYEAVAGYGNLNMDFTVGSNASVKYLLDREHDSFVQYAVIEEKPMEMELSHFILYSTVKSEAFDPALSVGFEDYNGYYGLADGENAIILMPVQLSVQLGVLYEKPDMTYLGVSDGVPVYACQAADIYVNRERTITEVSVDANGVVYLLVEETGSPIAIRCVDDVKCWALLKTADLSGETAWTVYQMGLSMLEEDSSLPCTAYLIMDDTEADVQILYLLNAL